MNETPTLVEMMNRISLGFLLLAGWWTAQKGDQEAHDDVNRRMGTLMRLADSQGKDA